MHCNRDILDNISTSIIALDSSLKVLALNSSGEDLLEFSEERSLGQAVNDLLLEPVELIEALQQVLDTGSPLSRRGTPLTLHSGREIHVDLMLTPAPTSDENIALLVELQPVDRLLKISREESLVHAQETTQEMIRGLAHEIKNPLGGVRGAAQLLARELPDPDLAEYTNIIIREADRLRDLVDRLLGPNQRLATEALNVHEIFEHVRDLIAAETKNCVELARDYDPSLPDVQGDRGQLIQAVLNIVRNALQASQDLDNCVITLRSRAQRQFTIGTKRHRLVCRLTIEDNGPGIPEDMLQTIFLPMVTGRADGTGLGLTIAQSIVTRHGGLLECRSEPGKTRFTIYLPMETNHV